MEFMNRKFLFGSKKTGFRCEIDEVNEVRNHRVSAEFIFLTLNFLAPHLFLIFMLRQLCGIHKNIRQVCNTNHRWLKFCAFSLYGRCGSY